MIAPVVPSAPPVWTLVFCDPEPLTPDATRRDRLLDWLLRRFLKPGFRHVFALRRAYSFGEGGFNGWFLLNPHSASLNALELRGNAYIQFLRRSQAQGHCTIVEITARQPTSWRLYPFFTCVAIIAHLTGHDGALTPWQFYQKLKDPQSPVGDPLTRLGNDP